MDSGLNLTAYDFVIIALMCLFIGRGAWVGFLRQITVLLALYVGYLMAGQYHDRLFPFLRGVSDDPQVLFWMAYVILFSLTYVFAVLLGKGLSTVVHLTIAVWFDKFLGAVLGFAKALIIVILIHMLLATLLAPGSQILNNCTLCPYLSRTEAVFKSLIKDKDLREAFQQKKQAITEQAVRAFSSVEEQQADKNSDQPDDYSGATTTNSPE